MNRLGLGWLGYQLTILTGNKSVINTLESECHNSDSSVNVYSVKRILYVIYLFILNPNGVEINNKCLVSDDKNSVKSSLKSSKKWLNCAEVLG